MGDALQFRQSVRRARTQIRDIVINIIDRKKEVIADLNAEQLSLGFRADGSIIYPSYSPLTVELKRQKAGLAAVVSHVTLYNTGSHYRLLYAELHGDQIEYGSRDAKSVSLEKKYATARGALYGLTEDSKYEFVEQHLRPELMTEIRNLTGLE